MQRQFTYPAAVERDEAGYFLVTFPDLPEAGTDGETLEEALTEAGDCLAETIAGRITRQEDVPEASRKRKNQHIVTLPAYMAAKAALYLTMKEQELSPGVLANLLNCNEKEVRRLLDPKHAAGLQQIEAALAAIGQTLIVGVQALAAG
jgi:antitoxin HicB